MKHIIKDGSRTHVISYVGFVNFDGRVTGKKYVLNQNVKLIRVNFEERK